MTNDDGTSYAIPLAARYFDVFISHSSDRHYSGKSDVISAFLDSMRRMRPDPAQLDTTVKVVAALGGIKTVMRLTRSKYKAAHHWVRLGRFPPTTHWAMTTALDARGYNATPQLWAQIVPDEEPLQ